jgi:hypothetical protein
MRPDRRRMTARIVPLRSREASEPPCPPTAAERLALLASLSREAWALTGQPAPSYTRATMPVARTSLRDQGRE